MIRVTKGDVFKNIQEHRLKEYLDAGWQQEVSERIKAVDEVVRLKPPVKTKATVRALEEANIDKGDE